MKLTSTGGGVDDQVEKGRDSAEARVQEESLVSRTEDCVVVPAPPYVPVPGTYRVGWPRTARKIPFLATNVRSRRCRRRRVGVFGKSFVHHILDFLELKFSIFSPFWQEN